MSSSVNFCYYAWFQASAANWQRAALLWFITQRVGVISYQNFWVQDFLYSEGGSDSFFETSVRNYHYSLRNDPEGSSSLPVTILLVPISSSLWRHQQSSTFFDNFAQIWVSYTKGWNHDSKLYIPLLCIYRNILYIYVCNIYIHLGINFIPMQKSLVYVIGKIE
jgi:hypothetical protein